MDSLIPTNYPVPVFPAPYRGGGNRGKVRQSRFIPKRESREIISICFGANNEIEGL
jgi:hypothetical protein